MTLLDVNILLYAHNQHSPEGPKIRNWLDNLDDQVWIGLPWLTIWGFLRISSNPRVFPNAWDIDHAFSLISSWIARPNVVIVEPGRRHAELLREMVTQYQVRGPLVTDAVLAALALEHGATLASTDQSFRRFDRISWVNPLAEGL